jgi:hypothetical protein
MATWSSRCSTAHPAGDTTTSVSQARAPTVRYFRVFFLCSENGHRPIEPLVYVSSLGTWECSFLAANTGNTRGRH